MITRFTSLLFALCIAIGVYAQSEIQILDKTYKVDTLFHSSVGPGTTQTSLQLSGPGYLRVFYLTIDLTNPLVNIRTVCAKDKVAGNETTSGMAERKSAEGASYFAGVNGDFFATSGTSTNGASIVGTPTGSCIVDGEIFKSSSRDKQFAIDINGLPFVGFANYTSGDISLDDTKAAFMGVNVGSPNDGITIYTDKYYGSTNQTSCADACAEVVAELVEGETFVAGKTCRMTIKSLATATGDLSIPTNGYVIHGRGTALDFVKNLKIGDVVTVNSIITIDDEKIVPLQMISGNPRTVGNGETLDTEGERGDASALHPRTGIGYGDNKKKVIMMVIDGRSTISQGVRTSQLAEVMRYAGATDAINLDGGGSSALYTKALGTRNHPSDGNERADGNAIFVVSSAPTDNTVASIKFVDWAMKFPKQGVYKPKFFGYNKYGELVDNDLQGVKLSCSPELGTIENDNTFIGSGIGTHALSAEYNGVTASIPVTIVAPDKVVGRLESIVHDTFRKYTIEVNALMGETEMAISSSALTWKSDDPSIVEVNANTGEITSKADGETTVRGTLGDTEVAVKVKVEKPTAAVMAMDLSKDASSWVISQVGGTGITATQKENGLELSYTGASGRSPNIKLTKELTLWSLPDMLRIRINPNDAPVKSLTLSVMSGTGKVINYAIPATIEANKMNIIDILVSDLYDDTDIATYPIKVNSLTLYMNTSTTGTKYTISIPGLETVYNALGSIDENIINKTSKAVIYPNPVKAGEKATLKLANDSRATVNIYTISGQLVSTGNLEPTDNLVAIETSAMAAGIYTIETIQNQEKATAILIIK